MNIAILHYHLNRGGVTQAIAAHLRAWDRIAARTESLRIAVLHGGGTTGWSLPTLHDAAVQVHTVPALGYDHAQAASSDVLTQQVRDVLDGSGFAPDRTVVHIHNHALGKNLAVAGTVSDLARSGYALLLQIHDFAEDLRPENHRRLAQALGENARPMQLYPQNSRIHYATLNARDENVLLRIGVPNLRLHRLPNAVEAPNQAPDRAQARQQLVACGLDEGSDLLLYPVRGIRRKNLGEALLWALLMDEARLGITLAPLNPVEHETYRHWKQLAEELKLGVLFEIGSDGGLGLAGCLAAADRVLTTSLAEGFGMAFLEPWLADRPLVGRDLPEITSDYVTAGLQLRNTRARLDVPLICAGPDMADIWKAAYRQMLRSYRLPPPKNDVLDASWNQQTGDGVIDFGSLDARTQSTILRTTSADTGLADAIRRLNPILTAPPEESDVIAANASVVREHYSVEALSRRLECAATAALESPFEVTLEAPEHPEMLLEAFLSPRRFRPLLAAS